VAERHAAHDLLLVAAFAADDLDAADRPGAEAQVAGCADCSALATDLVSIARATAEMPLPRRPRDFFVSPADARRLRPQGLRRLAAAIAGPRAQLARPVAGGLMMLGVAGLLVASLPGLSLLGSSSSADQRLEFLASPAPGSEVQGGPVAPYASEAPAASAAVPGDVRGAGQGASIPPGAGGTAASAPAPVPAVGPDSVKTQPETTREATTGPSPLVIGSVALIAVGAVLLITSVLQPGRRRS
jgi:hypothetical protein